MSELVDKLSLCIELGKINKYVPFPKEMQGQDGADELTAQALESGIDPDIVLQKCNEGMQRIGEKFGEGKVYVPELLMSAKAMNAVMDHLKPYFQKGNIKSKGKFNENAKRLFKIPCISYCLIIHYFM